MRNSPPLQMSKYLNPTQKKNDSSKKLYQINNTINEHYIQNLKSNNDAIKYLENRGITRDLIDKFDIGVASDSWDSATNILKSSNQIKDGLKIGLLVESKGRVYDLSLIHI